MSAVTQFKLFYFPLRARAEPLRMMLAYTGMPYENEIIPMNSWPEIKKARKLCPFGQLPSAQLADGTVIGQSCAIGLYIAKVGNIYPSDPVVAAKCDMIFYQANQELHAVDLLLNFLDCSSPDWQTKHDSFFSVLPVHLGSIDAVLGDQKFFSGDEKPCHADFTLYHVLDNAQTLKPDCLSAHPRVSEWFRIMGDIPQLRQYLDSRPQPPHVGQPQSFIVKKFNAGKH